MSEIQIWGTPSCGWCKKACDLLEQQGFKYDYYNALDDVDRFNELFPNAETVPQIIFRGERVGGYSDLCQTFENQNIFIGGYSIV